MDGSVVQGKIGGYNEKGGKMKVRGYSVFLVFIVVLSSFQVFGQSASSHHWYGVSYRIKHDYDKSITEFTEAIRIDPDYWEAYYDRASSYYAKGCYDNALADYAKLIELRPDFPGAYYSRGVTFEKKGNYRDAIIDFTKAIELDPSMAESYNDRGNAYKDKGELDKAIADYNKAIEINPKFLSPQFNLGNIHYEKGEFDEAIERYTKAIELYPNYPQGYLMRGNCYLAKQKYGRALSEYLKTKELYPYYPSLYNNISSCFLKLFDYKPALGSINKAIELKPNSIDYFEKKGRILLCCGKIRNATRCYSYALKIQKKKINETPKLGDYLAASWLSLFITNFQDAEQYAKKGFELFPSDVALHTNLGHAYLLQGKIAEANKEYQLFIENFKPTPKDILKEDFSWLIKRYPDKAALINETANNLGIEMPGDEERLFHQGLSAYWKSDYELATNLFKQALVLKPDYADALYYLGMSYWHLCDYSKYRQKSIDALRQAVANNPDDYQEAFYLLGLMYDYSPSGYQDAIEAFKNSIRLNPYSSWSFHCLGDCYCLMRQYENAVNSYGQAIILDPEEVEHYDALGHAFQMLQRHQDAIRAYSQALLHNPKDVQAHAQLCLIYMDLKDKDSALSEYKILKILNRKRAEDYPQLLYDHFPNEKDIKPPKKKSKGGWFAE